MTVVALVDERECVQQSPESLFATSQDAQTWSDPAVLFNTTAGQRQPCDSELNRPNRDAAEYPTFPRAGADGILDGTDLPTALTRVQC